MTQDQKERNHKTMEKQMWINDKVTYTPEVVTISKGEPQKATVKSVGLDGCLTLVMEDGNEQRVEARLCEAV